ncbi:MAG: PilZ domain-containing protein [Ruminiclostridium sp.]|jgi:hypothetical protein|nr:PilZ domain-containing protein [Ruminiclostridium sp.]
MDPIARLLHRDADTALQEDTQVTALQLKAANLPAVIEEEEELEPELTQNSFGLRLGTTVEVLTLENRLTFVGRVDRLKGEAVYIRESTGGELPPVLYNKEVKLRFFQAQRNLVLLGKICGSTKYLWKVDRLESKFAKEQRAFFRQRVSLDTTGLCSRRPSRTKPGKRAAACHVLDISGGGILISSREEYDEGDRLAISGIYLVETEEPYSFSCHVRRRLPEEETDLIRYGCQFESLTIKEQDRLLHAIFILQREEIRKQKEWEVY